MIQSTNPPKCVKCSAQIWGAKVGYFLLNRVSNKFDLYCENCWRNASSGMNLIYIKCYRK